MFKNKGISSNTAIAIIVILAILAGFFIYSQYGSLIKEKFELLLYKSGRLGNKNQYLQVDSPRINQKIRNPVTVSGKSNFFEANTRIKIKDNNGKILANTFTMAEGWMEQLYPFSVDVDYQMPTSERGVVEVFENSPKDGTEINKVVIPVIFEDYSEEPGTREIKLYYYNIERDKEINSGAVGCSENAVLGVNREIPVSSTPIQDTINLLIKGELTEQEKDSGFSTEFPNPDFKLLGANLKDGVLTLEFTEVPGFTTGGACRVGILAAEITKTAKQFTEVNEVVFKPESLFQP